MRRTSFARWPCSIARAVDILGDWWTPLVLREAYYGVRRFDDFEQALPVSRNVLAQRLRRLVDVGLLSKVPYSDRPPRFEYEPTEMGLEFWSVLAAMSAWGDRWLDGGDGAPILFHHAACGQDMAAVVVCSKCGQPISPEGVHSRLGPGYPDRLREQALASGRFG